MLKYGNAVGDLPEVSKVTVEYVQGPDCVGDNDNVQRIILETEDNGAGPFIRIRIPKDEEFDPGFWSVSGIEDLIPLFEDFKEKVNYIEPSYLKKQHEKVEQFV